MRHGNVFVRTNKDNTVWQNNLTANDSAKAGNATDVMTKPYADLRVESVSTSGVAISGQTLTINWTVANRGIGVTDVSNWADALWLSSLADGSGTITNLGSASHLGQLGVDGNYQRSLTVTLPQGIQGNYYVNVRTAASGGPFEFTYTTNNTATSLAVPIVLSPSPDLLVSAITVPATALEGSVQAITWSVTNSGVASVSGQWTDRIELVPVVGNAPAVVLGNFTYTQGLESGIS